MCKCVNVETFDDAIDNKLGRGGGGEFYSFNKLNRDRSKQATTGLTPVFSALTYTYVIMWK